MKAAFYTLGCKVNQAETEYMAELLAKAGFEIVGFNDDADYYIINSCTVTSTADQKTRQSVRRFKRKHPSSVVILTGCMPQAFPKDAEKLIEADIVLGNKNDGDILNLINRYHAEKKRILYISEHRSGDKFESCSINKFSERVRAFVKIEDGCDRFCSYCIIPTSRGRVRSKPLEDLKKEVQSLADNGIKEIVLVGINLSAYGKNEEFNILDAVKICAENDKIMRVRLGSLEPDHITDDILYGLKRTEKFCPQFHISLQSGCDKTLENMNRHYSADEYMNLCGKIRNTFEDASLTTDVMVGFCGESEADFRASLDFVKSIAFEKVHVFPYSERSGTRASKAGNTVPKAEKERRAEIMIRETDKMRIDYFTSLIGKTVCVLFENEMEPAIYQGYTKNYTPVRVKSSENIIGCALNARITGAFTEYCSAELLF